MTQEDLKIRICEEALKVCTEQQSAMAPQVRESIQNQLVWLISFFKGNEADREKLFQLTLGRLSVHEIDQRELELINAIRKAYYVAVRTSQGLKLEMDVLNDDA